MNRLRMAVIGVGHLGKEHARILAGMADVELVGVADAHEPQAREVAARLNTAAFTDYRDLLGRIDAACVAVPTSLHPAVAEACLSRSIHLLVEKPLAASAADAALLVELAAENHALLQVGHIERFNPAFEELQARPLRPLFLKAQRLGVFTGRSNDIGVVFDLMIHDLDLVLTLVKSPVRAVQAVGVSVFGGHEDLANARLEFADGCVAEVTASRASPTASRHMQVWAAEGYAEVDFAARKLTLVQPSDGVREHGLDPARLDPVSRSRLRDELFGRYLQTHTVDGRSQDQLACELRHFVDCVRTNETPRVCGAAGRDAVALAEKILTQIRTHAWDAGLRGPHRLPAPLGPLFTLPGAAEAA